VTKDYRKNAQIKGFRKGKAPLNLVIQRYGDLIQRDMFDEALQTYYNNIFNESNVTPVSQGKVTDFQFDNISTGMSFYIEVEVEPEFELKKYKGLRVEKDNIEINDKMVDDALERLREQYATVKEVDVAKKDHYVYFDAQELGQGDIPVVGHKYNDLQVQIGSGTFDLEIEEQLVGVKKGEKRIVKSITPPQPGIQNQQPTENSLEMHIKKIEEKDFPPLNGEFVKNLNDDSVATIEQLRERLQINMKLDSQYRSEQTFYNRLIDELLKENPFEIPPSMIENYLNEMINDFRRQSKDQTVNEEAIRKEYRVSAIHHLRWHFLKKKLMALEKIEISNEDINNHIESLDLEEKAKKQALKDERTRNRLEDDLFERKILEFLKTEANVIEVFPQHRATIKT
jgi:trigger factor